MKMRGQLADHRLDDLTQATEQRRALRRGVRAFFAERRVQFKAFVAEPIVLARIPVIAVADSHAPLGGQQLADHRPIGDVRGSQRCRGAEAAVAATQVNPEAEEQLLAAQRARIERTNLRTARTHARP